MWAKFLEILNKNYWNILVVFKKFLNFSINKKFIIIFISKKNCFTYPNRYPVRPDWHSIFYAGTCFLYLHHHSFHYIRIRYLVCNCLFSRKKKCNFVQFFEVNVNRKKTEKKIFLENVENVFGNFKQTLKKFWVTLSKICRNSWVKYKNSSRFTHTHLFSNE